MKELAIITVLGMIFMLTGCETMKGLGSDIQKAGKAIEKKASD